MVIVPPPPGASGRAAFFCGAAGFPVFAFALARMPSLPPGLSAQAPLAGYALVLLAWGFFQWRTRNWRVSWPVWLSIALVLCLQGMGMYASALDWGVRVSELLAAYGGLLARVAVLAGVAAGTKLVCRLPGGPSWLLRGVAASLALLLALVGLQVFWALTRPEMREPVVALIGADGVRGGLEEAHAGLGDLLSGLGRWAGAFPYAANPDGVFVHAQGLVATLALGYAPFLFGYGALAGGKFRWPGRVLLAGLVAAMLGCASSAPVPAVAGILFVCLWSWRRPLRRGAVLLGARWLHALCVVVVLLSLAALLLHTHDATRDLAARLSADPAASSGSAASAEQIVRAGEWRLVRQHPLAGVGHGWAGRYLVDGEAYVRAMAENSPAGETLREWRQNGLPPVCPLLLLAAEFGLPPVLLLLASFIWLRQRLARLPALPGTDGGAARNRTFLLAVCDPYLAAVALFSLINVDWRLPALMLPFFFLWAMAGVREEPAPPASPAAPDMAAGAAVQQIQPGRPDGQPAGQGAGQPLISHSASRPFTFS
jgi:hypothetical protein